MCSRRWGTAVVGLAAAVTSHALSVGMDLGTSNSCVAVVSAAGKPEMVPLMLDTTHRATLLPSVCEFEPTLTSGEATNEDGSTPARIRFSSPEEEAKKKKTSLRPKVTAWKRALGLSAEDASWALSARESRRLRLDDGALDEDGEVGLWVATDDDDDRTYRARPRECHAALIAELKTRAETALEETIDKAVVGVPAMYLQSQRDAVQALVQEALGGADVAKVQIVSEPELAAHAYGFGDPNEKRDKLVLVFDLGGGTLDVSFVAVGGPTRTMEVVATAGDPCLGGIDFTRALADEILTKAKRELGPARWQHVRVNDDALFQVADAAKIALSDHDTTDVGLDEVLIVPSSDVDDDDYPYYDDDDDDDDDDRVSKKLEKPMTVARSDLERACGDLFRETAMCVRRAALLAGAALPGDAEAFVRERERDERGRKLKKKKKKHGGPAEKRWKETMKEMQDKLPKGQTLRAFPSAGMQPIDDVVLVGGASKMAGVRTLLETLTGCSLSGDVVVDPEHAVATGAAVRAAMNDQRVDDFVVLDQWRAELLRHFAGKAGADGNRRRARIDDIFGDGPSSSSSSSERRRTQKKKKDDANERGAPKRDELGRRLVTVKGPDGQPETIIVEDWGDDDEDDDLMYMDDDDDDDDMIIDEDDDDDDDDILLDLSDEEAEQLGFDTQQLGLEKSSPSDDPDGATTNAKELGRPPLPSDAVK